MKILDKEVLADSQGARVIKLTVQSPDIAVKTRAGQFVVLMVKEEGERIPLTIVNADPVKGSIVLIVQAAGFTTKLLADLKEGDSLYSLAGPLGHPTEIKKYTVNRSPFIYKNSREQFEMRVHRRVIDIINPSPKIMDSLTNLSLPSGVNIDVKIM